MHIDTLVEMLNDHTPLVVEMLCEARSKFTSEQPLYIGQEKAIAILKAGFEKQRPCSARKCCAREGQLLRAGRSGAFEVGQ